MAQMLTDKAIEKLKADPKKRREVPDGRVPGLYLVIQPSGRKSWAMRYRHLGKPYKMTLDGFPSLKKARELAAEALDALAEGRNPGEEKKAARAEAADKRNLFRNVAADFIERYAKRKNRAWDQTERIFHKHVNPTWGDRRIQDITRRDVVELLDGIADRGLGITANRTLAAVRKLFNWCVERDIVPISPCAGVKAPAPETNRDRILTDDEIRWLWKATEQQGYPFGPLARLLLLTGQRRNEVAGMTAAELDLAERQWLLPASRAKNNRENLVPLSDAAMEVIEALPRIASRKGFLFTRTGETHVTGYSRGRERIAAKMLEMARAEAAEGGADPGNVTIPNWTLHDLRRTASSGMARLRIEPHVIEATLNHKSGIVSGVAATYNRYSYLPEKTAALDAWSRYIMVLVGRETAGNVVPLREPA